MGLLELMDSLLNRTGANQMKTWTVRARTEQSQRRLAVSTSRHVGGSDVDNPPSCI